MKYKYIDANLKSQTCGDKMFIHIFLFIYCHDIMFG